MSWKTTTCAWLAGVGQGIQWIEGIPHWLLLAGKIIALAGVVGLGQFARDNDKSSEEVGAKPGPLNPPSK